jgi:hypothetical protein
MKTVSFLVGEFNRGIGHKIASTIVNTRTRMIPEMTLKYLNVLFFILLSK